MISQIAQAIRGSLVLNDVLQTLANQLGDILQVSGCLIFQAESEQPLAESAKSGAIIQQDSNAPQRLRGVCQDFFKYYHSRLAQGKLLLMPITERQLPTALQDSARVVGLSSLLIVPFLYRQSYIGSMTLYQCEKKRQWLPQEIAFVQAIADQCTIALALAKLEERSSIAAKQRQESEKRFDALCNQSRQLMGLLTPEGVIVEANQTALDFAGLEAPDILGRPFWEAPWWMPTSETDMHLQEAFTQQLFRSVAAAATGQFIRYEVNVLGKVGKGDRFATLDISLTPHRDETGKVVLLMFEGRDITDYKRAQFELQESVARNKALLEAIPDEILRLTRSGIYLDCKTAREELLPIPAQKSIGKHLHDCFPREVAGLIWHNVELALETNEIQIIEYQLWIKGKSHDFEARIVKSGADEVLVIVQDVTERVQARVALEQINQALEIRVHERTVALREANHILRAEIVDRKKIDLQLRESEERFRQAVVNAPFPIMIHAQDGEIVQINQVWTELTGYTHNEIPTIAIWAQKAYGECQDIELSNIRLGDSLAAECSTSSPLPDDASVSSRRYDLNDQVDEGEVSIITKDGVQRIWYFRSAPSGRLTDGRRLTISMAMDLTERKQAERAAHFLHSVTQAIFESQDFHAALKVALQKVCEATGWDFGEAWVPRADGSVLECSPAWYGNREGLEVFRSASETLTFSFGVGLPGRVWASKQPEWRRDVSVESNEVFRRNELASEVGLKAGLGIPLLTTSSVLAVLVFYMFESKDEDQRLIELISASTELGLMIQRKQAEEEVHKALVKEKELTELKSRFISMTSHEFRTPLTTIQSSAELLEYYSQKWTQEKKLTHLHRIQSSVKHMTNLLDDVLIIGKADAGKLTFNPSPLDVEKFCRNLVEELQLNDTEQHNIIFTCEGKADDFGKSETMLSTPSSVPSSQLHVPTLPCLDEKLLRQILENLLSNAIKYSPEGSTIEFSLSRFSSQAVFLIRDQGIGIPLEDQQLLFESFHRATNVGTIAGTGLGLTIVKKCVDIHEGQVTVESEVGVGTTFSVTLPT